MLNVCILFGGKSAEHEVSISSANNILYLLNTSKYRVIPIHIPKSGKLPRFPKNVDVVFPVLHGPCGEDGTIQGLLETVGVPYVGAGVLGSAIGMDKDVQKRLLREAGIKVPKYQVLTNAHQKPTLPFPFFVKPANLGSSIGVSKVVSKKDLLPALKLAFKFENKVLIEEEIQGKEIEVSVLGTANPLASLPGEVRPRNQFYDYSAKYDPAAGTEYDIPAKLSTKKIKEFQILALKVFNTLCCKSMARIDFFLKSNGQIVVNEINTIPGFTNSSMYPKLWEASGLSQQDLVDKLIDLALNSHRNS